VKNLNKKNILLLSIISFVLILFYQNLITYRNTFKEAVITPPQINNDDIILVDVTENVKKIATTVKSKSHKKNKNIVKFLKKTKIKSNKPLLKKAKKINMAEVNNNLVNIVKIKSIKDFKITSLSVDRAVINGNKRSFIVRNGKNINILGEMWLVTILPKGVSLMSSNEKVNLIFDSTLRPVFDDNNLLFLPKRDILKQARKKPPLIKTLKMINP